MGGRLAALALVACSSPASGAAPDVTAFNPVFTSPSAGPGKTQGGLATYMDACPIGNGALTALAWANVSAGGVGLYLGHQMAQSSHTELFKLGRVLVTLSPNPFVSGTFFRQETDISTGTVTVWAGGSSVADAAAVLAVWADANSDTVFVDITSPTGATFSLSATVTSTRPSTPWIYQPAFGFCGSISAQPDVFVDPLPAPVELTAPPPQSAADSIRHASGGYRPTRKLAAEGRLPRIGAFQAGTVISYHRNVASDGLSLNMTLSQQGLAQLIATTPEHWVDNQFGFALDGGAGPVLVRISPRIVASAAAAPAFQLRFTVLAVQTDSASDWLAELSARVTASLPAPRAAHVAWWQSFWARSYISVNATAGPGDAFTLSAMYAVTRYTQAIQSRGTLWPIKFNGMAFIAAMDAGNGEADRRDWGPSTWWQNARLPYGAMLLAGDFDLMRVILDYYVNMEKLLGPRTVAYWGHTGMWTTETQHLSGAYDMSDYGCGRPTSNPKYPVSLMESGYLHVDQGGDSGTGEYALMALDYFLWTGDARYLNLAYQSANYFLGHFKLNATSGRVVIFPAQVLETYWCDFDVNSQSFTNCCSDDAPTISGMITLFEKLAQLPASVTTPEQRAAWAAFTPTIPLLPVDADKVILPARILSTGTHNSEGPELYAMHPHRVFTKGKEVASGFDISVGLATNAASGWSRGNNNGWSYGINAAVLLGDTAQASAQVVERARQPPAAGYRFPGFAPHLQDFDPSADHFANMNRAAQEMLLQEGGDGFASTTIVLFPAWPCSWDVDFKLQGPLNTTVEVSYAGGKLVSLVVTPTSRTSAIKWAACVV